MGQGASVSGFEGRHLENVIVLWAGRWYSRYGVSYRDLEEMAGERGVSVHQTVLRATSPVLELEMTRSDPKDGCRRCLAGSCRSAIERVNANSRPSSADACVTLLQMGI